MHTTLHTLATAQFTEINLLLLIYRKIKTRETKDDMEKVGGRRDYEKWIEQRAIKNKIAWNTKWMQPPPSPKITMVLKTGPTNFLPFSEVHILHA